MRVSLMAFALAALVAGAIHRNPGRQCAMASQQDYPLWVISGRQRQRWNTWIPATIPAS